MSLKTIKNKIRSIDKTHKVTKAMEAVSAVKMRKSQQRALLSRPYALSALRILKRVSGSIDVVNHPLLTKRSGGNTLLIIVTSDKGLAGSLNTAVLKDVSAYIQEHDLTTENTSVITLGNKGYDFAAVRGFTVRENYPNLSDRVAVEDMRAISNSFVELFIQEEIDNCIVFYTEFASTFEQHAVHRTLLPITVEELTAVVEEIIPTQGKYAEVKETEKAPSYTLEPDSEEILLELLPFLVNIQLYHALLESKASEHSARMVAMKNASDKADELSKALTLEFNKARQSMITREVSEITSGMETLSAV